MAAERFSALAAVLEAIRGAGGITQPVLGERVGLGRSVVAERVAELEAAGLVVPDGLGPSTGGRAPRRLRLNERAGFVIGVDIASNELVVGVADLAGGLRATRHEQIDVTDGPEIVLQHAEALVDEMIGAAGADGRIWGVGAGIPGPVAFDTGMPAAVPVMPGWAGYPIRKRLSERWAAPAWVDNRVNLLALGEIWSNPAAAAARQMLYLGDGASVAVAAVIDGKLYRGHHGLAGAIGHVAVPGAGITVCRCGRIGCVESVAGGWAIARDGLLLAQAGQSPELAATLAATGTIRPLDITLAATRGDGAAAGLLRRTALLLGGNLAVLVSFFAPELLVIGGGLAHAGQYLLDPIRESIHGHLPLATDLRIEISTVDDQTGGILGALQLALGQLFARDHLPLLLESRA